MSGQTKRFIYFCGSIRGGRDDAALYRRIIDQLKEYGDVLTEHIADPNVLHKDQGLRKSRAKITLLAARAFIDIRLSDPVMIKYFLSLKLHGAMNMVIIHRKIAGFACIGLFNGL